MTVEHEGIPIDLKLQKRLDQHPEPYYCLCWRTRYLSSPGSNRKFYSSSDAGFWTLPVSVALCLLRQAEECGMLGFKYDDRRFRDGNHWSTIIDSRELDVSQQLRYRDEIICDREELEWGGNPLFIICQTKEYKWIWRKIMVVDTERNFCTFRSTTTSDEYKMGIFKDRLEGPWRLDNAMQEASAASMREFLRCLEEISQ